MYHQIPYSLSTFFCQHFEKFPFLHGKGMLFIAWYYTFWSALKPIALHHEIILKKSVWIQFFNSQEPCLCHEKKNSIRKLGVLFCFFPFAFQKRSLKILVFLLIYLIFIFMTAHSLLKLPPKDWLQQKPLSLLRACIIWSSVLSLIANIII